MTRFSSLSGTFAAVGMFAGAGSAFAAITDTVGPDDLASGKPDFSAPHGTGDNPFAYDWDSARPDTAAGAPVGYGDTSFYASVNQAGSDTADRYRTFRIGVQGLVSGATISDLTGISYMTSKAADASAIDWRISIYTSPTDSPDAAASWYDTRIQSFPDESLLLSAPANQWNTWTTADGAANELVWGGNGSLGGADGLDWAAIQAVVGDEQIMMIDFTLGANSGGGTGASSLDAIRLSFGSEIVDVNLIPEPASLALLGLGGAAALLRRRAV